MNHIDFFDEVHDFQRFVRENIKLIGNYTIISEQLTIRNNETGIMDILALDNEEKRLVILELKNEKTTDKSIWQPIRYYDLIQRGEDSLKKLLVNPKLKLDYSINEINLNPEVVLIVPECNDQILRSMSHFTNIDLKVVQLNRSINNGISIINKETFFPKSIFHKEDVVDVLNKPFVNWDFNEYEKVGISKDKLNLAKLTINQIKKIFLEKGYSFDLFFYETKITITKNKKVWGHIFIKQKPLDYKLTLSFKFDNNFDKSNFYYNHCIYSFTEQKDKIKIVLNSALQIDFFQKII